MEYVTGGAVLGLIVAVVLLYRRIGEVQSFVQGSLEHAVIRMDEAIELGGNLAEQRDQMYEGLIRGYQGLVAGRIAIQNPDVSHTYVASTTAPPQDPTVPVQGTEAALPPEALDRSSTEWQVDLIGGPPPGWRHRTAVTEE